MMIYENDQYEIPTEVLKMSKEELKEKLEKEKLKMNRHPGKKPKAKLKKQIRFNF